MSAEKKKQRGEAGVAKAKSSPYRLNGFAPDWQARRAGAYQAQAARSSGRKTLQGLIGGFLAEKLGFAVAGSPALYDQMVAHAEDRIDEVHRRGASKLEERKDAA